MRGNLALAFVVLSAIGFLVWIGINQTFYKRQQGTLMMVRAPQNHTAEGIWTCEKEDYDPRILLSCPKCTTPTTVLLNCPNCLCGGPK